MDTFFITIFLVLIIYAFGLYFWSKQDAWKLTYRSSRRVILVHYAFAFLVLVSIALQIADNLSFRGHWTTRAIIIGFLVSGILIFPLTNRNSKSRIEKFYFGTFSLLPFLIFLFSLIPFLGIVALLSGYGQLTDPVKKVYYEDNKVRIQSSFVGALGPPRLLVFQKKGFFEKQLVHSFKSAIDTDSISIGNEQDSMLILMYDDSQVTDTLRIERVE